MSSSSKPIVAGFRNCGISKPTPPAISQIPLIITSIFGAGKQRGTISINGKGCSKCRIPVVRKSTLMASRAMDFKFIATREDFTRVIENFYLCNCVAFGNGCM